jgi:hypothetical protein
MQFAACTIKAAPLQTTGTHNMTLTDLELETLRKFNSGKNASALTNKLAPGTYPVRLTITLDGVLRKGMPGETNSRNTSGAAAIVRYLLDRINQPTYERLIADLTDIRAGEFQKKNDKPRFADRLDTVMPYRKYPRQGTTSFKGAVIAEDLSTESNTTWPTGLQLSGSNND